MIALTENRERESVRREDASAEAAATVTKPKTTDSYFDVSTKYTTDCQRDTGRPATTCYSYLLRSKSSNARTRERAKRQTQSSPTVVSRAEPRACPSSPNTKTGRLWKDLDVDAAGGHVPRERANPSHEEHMEEQWALSRIRSQRPLRSGTSSEAADSSGSSRDSDVSTASRLACFT